MSIGRKAREAGSQAVTSVSNSLRSTASVRGKVAMIAGGAASTASRALGRGSGGMIGGRIASKISPTLLADLAKNKTVVIVSGTNGKSTTTRMITKALEAGGFRVTTNRGGDNMADGALAALMEDPLATHAVLEIDEMWVARVARAVNPTAFVYLNLSRDQLDRVGEISSIEHRLREAVAEHPHALAVANIDDPLVTSAAWDSRNPVWVAAGRGWSGDSLTSPRTGGVIIHTDVEDAGNRSVPLASGRDTHVHWRSVSLDGRSDAGFERPAPQWSWSSPSDTFGVGEPITVYGESSCVPVTVNLPGRANRSNASQALAVAVALGVPPARAAEGIAQVTSVAGRYAAVKIGNHNVRLLLAKNPAGWQESLTMLTPGASLVVGVNGQIPDGVDLSWLWDVDFDVLAGRNIVATGERGADLHVRLTYSGIRARFEADPLAALALLPAGDVDMLLNYTSFRDTRAALIKKGYDV